MCDVRVAICQPFVKRIYDDDDDDDDEFHSYRATAAIALATTTIKLTGSAQFKVLKRFKK